MKKNFLSANLTKAAFVIATVFTISLAFYACSDKDEPNQENPTELKDQAMINGKVHKIKSAKLVNKNKDLSNLFLYFENGEYMVIHAYPEHNDKPIYMNGQDYKWSVLYYSNDNKVKFFVAEDPGNDKCDQGIIKFSVNQESGLCSVEIKDGHIPAKSNTDGDKQEYTFAVKWADQAQVDNSELQ